MLYLAFHQSQRLPDTEILTLGPSRPNSSITLCFIKEVCEPESRKQRTIFEFPLEPHKTAGTVCRITFPMSSVPTELAVTFFEAFFDD
jgi:hypothetical protein